MATQYDPIAKDESLHTTELNPRNITDVLASGMNSIVSALTPGELEDLSDVTISSPTDGQVLKYDSATQKWINGAGGGADPTPTAWEQSGKFYFRKCGHIVHIRSNETFAITVGYYTLGTIPEGFRPDVQLVVVCIYESSGSYLTLPVIINTDGTIQIYSNLNKTIRIELSQCYIA